MQLLYQIFGYSVPNIGKEKNGDSFLYKFLEDEQVLIAAVADGVSKQPCDWLASQTACQQVVEHFTSNRSQPDLAKRLIESVHYANDHITRVEGKCQRMASTLTVIVWPVETDAYWYVNIGDSRIYSSWEGQVALLTQDDATLVKERVLTHGGLRVVEKSMLTKVIGQSGLAFRVGTKPFREGEVIVLATDGFYEARKAIYASTIADLSQHEHFTETCQATVEKLEMLRGDDLTALLIKRV